MSDGKPTNELAQARSAYLRSAAHQPVQWREWGDAAFEQARREDKPILLDIGAVWCHWCHVMDRESYENEEIARLINEHYIAVKVDRDERPDIDARYQMAVSALTGQGGWPLTAFLTPEGKPFYGGTYFPPDDRFGRPGMKRVLASIAHNYRDPPGRDPLQRRPDLRRPSAVLRTFRRRRARPDRSIARRDHVKTSAACSIRSTAASATRPSFPTRRAIDLLLRRLSRDAPGVAAHRGHDHARRHGTRRRLRPDRRRVPSLFGGRALDGSRISRRCPMTTRACSGTISALIR